MSEEKKFTDQELHALSEEELNEVTGGAVPYGVYNDRNAYYVHVEKNYLALRTAPEYKYENEIGKMWNDYTFRIYPTIRPSGVYVYGYCDQLGMEGWTNSRFLYAYYRDPYLD